MRLRANIKMKKCLPTFAAITICRMALATSRRKSPCDGVAVKRLTSLQATVNNQRLTPHDMYSWARDNMHGIEFLFVMRDQVQ